MTKRILPSQFNRVAQFEKQGNTTTGAGVNIPKPQFAFTLHYAPVTRSLTQQYLAQQVSNADTIVIAIRHNPKVSQNMLVKIDGTEYEISSLSANDQFDINAYDYLTLTANNEVGV